MSRRSCARYECSCFSVVFQAAVKQNKKENNKLKNHVSFGGPDVHKLQKTAKITGFDYSGSLPEWRIEEFEAAKMTAIFRVKSLR